MESYQFFFPHSQHAQWILNKIENTFKGTFAGLKNMAKPIISLFCLAKNLDYF